MKDKLPDDERQDAASEMASAGARGWPSATSNCHRKMLIHHVAAQMGPDSHEQRDSTMLLRKCVTGISASYVHSLGKTEQDFTSMRQIDSLCRRITPICLHSSVGMRTELSWKRVTESWGYLTEVKDSAFWMSTFNLYAIIL